MADKLDSNWIESNDYIADILRVSGAEPFWYYLLQRKDSSGIIDLAKFANYEEAVRAARLILARMGGAAAGE